MSVNLVMDGIFEQCCDSCGAHIAYVKCDDDGGELLCEFCDCSGERDPCPECGEAMGDSCGDMCDACFDRVCDECQSENEGF